MRILFISDDLIGVGVAHKLKKEGHDVKLFVRNRDSHDCFDNIIPRVNDWKDELTWVRKDGLIVFDEIGYGKIQDKLRKDGYTVFGGCEISDKLEEDRAFAHEIFKQYGLKTVDLIDFDNIELAIEYIKENPKAWVIKQNGNLSKTVNYVGHFEDGKDVISLLKNYLHNKLIDREKITIQKKINGVEIAVGRYFNGKDWIGPIEMNVEHKKLFPGDIGPMTSEMGTLAWYDTNEKNKLFLETLSKIKPFLQKINFRGIIDINCIVNENGSFPLEATARMGSPIVNLQTEMHISPWGTLMHAIAKGEQYDMKCKEGYGIINLVATPPFPFSNKNNRVGESLMYGINIYFDNLAEADMDHLHFEEVSIRADSRYKGTHYISGCQGYVLYVSNVGESVKKARESVNNIIKKIIIPKMIYRNDIGLRFENEDATKLKKWGYIK